MKIKNHLYITDPVGFDESKGSDNQFAVSSSTTLADGHYTKDWVYACPVEFDVPINKDAVIAKACQAVDVQIKEEQASFEVKMGLLKEKKASLLAIEHK